MAMEHEVTPPQGMRRRRRRVGRGDGSGRGSYSGRGMKGQKARSGKGPRPGFEGGQIPLTKRLPMVRGFVNIFRVHYAEVKVGQLEERFEAGAEVTPQALVRAGVLRDLDRPVKVLGDGELSKPLTVRAHRFSAAARQKIEGAGGTAEVL